MNHFTIKDIENISGIKAHTLRIWEKRYGIITPKRKQSKHRFYDNEDLKHVLRITHLYKSGHRISAIANMPKDDLKEHDIKNSNSEFALIKILLETTLDLNEQEFIKNLDKAIARFGLESCIIKIIYPYFEKIGMLWLNNQAIPAQERFAGNIIIKKIIGEIDKLDGNMQAQNNAIVLFTPPQEHHEIPLLFLHYLLKKSGNYVYYLGTNVGFEILIAFIKSNRCQTLCFHLITNLTNFKIDNYVNELTQKFSNHNIIMSGKFTNNVSIKAGNLRLLNSLQEMIDFGNGKMSN